MKQIIVFLLALLLAVLAFNSLSHAGVLGSAKDFILDNMLGKILSLTFMFIFAFFGGTKIGKLIIKAKLPIYEAKDVLLAVRKARRDDSPAGKGISPEERDLIWREVEELAGSIIVITGGKVED